MVFGSASGQQLPIYTQYKLNAHVINPSIAGAFGYTNVNLTARNQWLGFQGSPNTYTLSGEWRMLKRGQGVGSGILGMRRLQKSRGGNVGLSAVVFRDINGAVSRTGAKGSYAYHIQMRQSQLSLGVAASVFQFKVDKDKLIWEDAGSEPLLTGGFREAIVAPDASIGAFYLARFFYFGIAGEQLFQTVLKIGSQALNDYKLLRHYNINTGYRIRITKDYDIEPSILMKVTEPDVKKNRGDLQTLGESSVLMAKFKGLRQQSDIHLKLYYKDDYWGGISYRTNGDLIIMGGVRYNNMYIGYSFDYTLSRIMSYSYGSHEISLGMRFGTDKKRSDYMQRW